MRENPISINRTALPQIHDVKTSVAQSLEPQKDAANVSGRDGAFSTGTEEKKGGNRYGPLFAEEMLFLAVGSLLMTWKRLMEAEGCAWLRLAHDRSVGIWLRSFCVLPHGASPRTP